MLENLINQLITVAVGLAILGGSYLVWLLSGVANVLFNPDRKWSWKRMFEDLTKALLMSIALLAWVAVFDALDWFSTQMGADITEILEGASVAGVIGGIIGGTVYYIGKAYKNFYEFINKNHVEPKIEAGSQNYKTVAEKIYEIFDTREEVVEHQKEVEKTGAQGTFYKLDISSYDTFRKQVIGKGFDVDGKYGYQCWDGACLLWENLDRWLYTGDGSARGCWTLERDRNAGNDFDLIYKKEDIKRGDVVVFSCGQYGHIGYADEDFAGNTYIRLLGQNQTPDMKFSVINMSLGTFLGAFRYHGWVTNPGPAPEPSGDVVEYTYKAGDTFGQVINDLGLRTWHGLWGPDGDVAYYTAQLGITGNIPIGTHLVFHRRTD